MSLTRIPAKVGKALMKKYSKKRGGRRRVAMPKAPTGSFASRQETFSITGTDGTVYDLNNLRLTNLAVCSQLADFYQYYRITSVQMRFKPNFDTFIAPGAFSNNPVIPYLYFLYDKSGSLGTLSGPQFEQAGAKPIRFDDKTIIRKWKPSVATITDLGTSQFKTSPWLPTQDFSGSTLNNVAHLGAVWYLTKMNTVDAVTYDIDVTVTVQYRKPLVQATPGVQSVDAMGLVNAPAQVVNVPATTGPTGPV